MKNTIKKIPTPIVGLMLALAATGNLVLSYGEGFRNFFGLLSFIIFILFTLKIVIYPNLVKADLENPLVASVFPTYSMGLMLLAGYLKPYLGSFSQYIWFFAVILHGLLIINFTRKFVVNFDLAKVFPSWFIVYVGIVVGAVSAPAFSMEKLGRGLFWFGFISYFIVLLPVLKKLKNFKNFKEPARPSLAIMAAPVALCLAGYMSSFETKNTGLVFFMLILSQSLYFFVIFNMFSLLKSKFYPSFSAFTFPLVISAISLKLTNGYLVKSGLINFNLKLLVNFEELVAVLISLYVLVKYLAFIFKKVEE